MNNLTLHRWLVAFGWCLIVCSALFIHWYGMFEQHRTTPRAYFCLLASVWWTIRMSRHVLIFKGGVMSVQIPEGFFAAQDNAQRIREAFPDLSSVQLDTACIILIAEGALNVVKSKMGELYKVIPPNLLVETIDRSLYDSHIIRDCAWTILAAQGRDVRVREDEVVFAGEQFVSEGGVS